MVLPSEITEGLLPHNKCLRGFVVEKKSKTVAGGKVVVEIHVVAKDDPCEVYLLEAWGAVATRAEKLEQKAYEFIKFVAKSAEGKAAWTPSTAPTWGSMGAASEWKEVDAAGFPRTYPTTTLETLKGIDVVQQVCVKGKMIEISTKVVEFESKRLQSRRSRVKTEATSEPAKEAKGLSTAVLVEGEQNVGLECWDVQSALLEDIVDGSAVQINRALWKVDEKKGGFVLKAIPGTSVTILHADAAQADQNAASNVPIALNVKFDAGAVRTLQSEGKAKVTSLSQLLNLLDKDEPDKALNEDLWEVFWVHITKLRNTKIDSEQLSYIGCKQCNSKECQKHSPKEEIACYALQASLQDATAKVDAKCFTKVAYQLFEAMCGEEGPFSDEDIRSGLSEAAFSLRLRVGYEDAWQSRKERNFVEVVAAKPLPWTFMPQMRITALRGVATGAPDVFLDACSVNALGHLVLATQRHGQVRFLAKLQGKPVNSVPPDNSGIRVEFAGVAYRSATEEAHIKLLWTAALEDIQPLMQLKDKDLLYISAHATNKKGTWTVATYKVLNTFDTSSIVDAFKARAAFAADFLNGAISVEMLEPDTPMKRKQRLDQGCKETTDIGMYEA